ncbi:Glutathione S-transferase, C-terminal domain [Enhydrobacter aerosaccus]|uniref:Glutathione S-transferase, C-terminal domain n=1 Tax=Enhydrobacter aerosaccus TaxID=225324 RepID=A0A1T4LEY2_9HYPH|nr:glutathione S-transferase N-terminal domain-containing protein [Enhydrobacter aerosaccus]SJZ53186.1 Glutathione S-transferase, C-terminal domain [Enhydrobacter aerosaccus]
MITLYDLVFQDDRRPSPFCWRAKYALSHKGLKWVEEPMGFTEKQKIAFAGSQTVPVIKDGAKSVKDSWAIALHLDQAHPDKPLFESEAARILARFVGNWVDTAVHVAVFPLIVGDLYDRVRPVDQAYFRESRGPRLGTTDFSAFQAKAREKGLAAFQATLEPARRLLKEQLFLAGGRPGYPDYALAGAFLWARITSPVVLLETDDPVHAWRERMLDLFDGMGRRAKAA